MPAVSVSKTVKAVELMAAEHPGDLLIATLKTLGTEGAQAARNAGAGPDEVLLPIVSLELTLRWE